MSEVNAIVPVTVGIDGRGNALLRITTNDGIAVSATLNRAGTLNLIRLLGQAVRDTHEVIVKDTPAGS